MKHLAVLCLSVLTILGGLVAVVPRNSQALGASSVGSLYGSYFETDYVFQVQAGDCSLIGTHLTSTLLLDNTPKRSFDHGCPALGTSVFGFLFDFAATGTWTLVMSGTPGVLHTHSWKVPTLVLSATVTQGTVNAGDSVWVGVRLDLSQGGVDWFSREGLVTINVGQAMTQHLIVDAYNSAYETFWGLPARPERHYFVTGMPLSFATAGTKTIGVQFSDSLHSLSSSPLSVNVVSPLASAISSIDQRLTKLESQVGTTDVGAALAEIRGEVAALQSSTSSNDTAAQKALADLKTRIDNLQAKLATTESRVSATSDTLFPAQIVSYVSLFMGVVAIAVAIMLGRKRPPVRAEAPPP